MELESSDATTGREQGYQIGKLEVHILNSVKKYRRKTVINSYSC